MSGRQKALNNWKNLVDAVYFSQDPPITTYLDSVAASLHEAEARLSAPFNILPLAGESRLMDFREVIAARDMLNVPGIEIRGLNQGEKDVFHALAVAFRFQIDNLNNQREHLILLLANTKLELYYKDTDGTGVHQEIINKVCDKTLENYKSWCSYIRKECVYDGASDFEKLAYAALYLCIWGEAANVRFLPECICYLFHILAQELKEMLRDRLITCSESVCKDNLTKSFLEVFIAPIYEDLKKEAEKGKGGEAHSKWRNYDDFNEFYWSRSCFTPAQGSNANVRSLSVGSVSTLFVPK